MKMKEKFDFVMFYGLIWAIYLKLLNTLIPNSWFMILVYIIQGQYHILGNWFYSNAVSIWMKMTKMTEKCDFVMF